MSSTVVCTRGIDSPARNVLLDDLAALDLLQLRAHERAALAGLDVLELDDLPDHAVELDVHAVLELVGVDRLSHGPLHRRGGTWGTA